MILKLPYGAIAEHVIATRGHDMAAEHRHSYYELFFLMNGVRRFVIRDKMYEMVPGDFALIEPNSFHRTFARRQKGYESYGIYFAAKTLFELFRELPRETFAPWEQGGCFRLRGEDSERIRENLKALDQVKEGVFAEAFRVHCFREILLTAFAGGEEQIPISSATEERIYSAVRYCNEHVPDFPDLSRAAELVHMEKTYFSRCFKRVMGVGFQEYGTRLRLERAQDLLIHSDLSVGEISQRCGFFGSHYFSDAFRTKMGVSPSRYRREKRKETVRNKTEELSSFSVGESENPTVQKSTDP